jgi:hypothetical protein
MMPSNVYVLPAYGKPITLDDQGIFLVFNRHSQAIQTIIKLAYLDSDWHMFQLQASKIQGEYYWSVMASEMDSALNSMSTQTIMHHFSRPEFSEPRGAWQVLHNVHYGFGKFTPVDAQQPSAYGFLMFDGNQELKKIISLHKAADTFMQDNGIENIPYKQAGLAYS